VLTAIFSCEGPFLRGPHMCEWSMLTRLVVVYLRGHHSHIPPLRSHIPTPHMLAEGQEHFTGVNLLGGIRLA
jgi:hypothetical protein